MRCRWRQGSPAQLLKIVGDLPDDERLGLLLSEQAVGEAVGVTHPDDASSVSMPMPMNAVWAPQENRKCASTGIRDDVIRMSMIFISAPVPAPVGYWSLRWYTNRSNYVKRLARCCLSLSS